MSEEWVSLSEAADLLGVHPNTVRAWADKGELPSRRTPGGHRRFRRADLMQGQHSAPALPAETEMMVQSALGRARMQMGGGELDQLVWYQQFGDEARRQHRTMGRELLTLLTTYLTSPGQKESVLDGARQLGTQYGDLAFRQGLGLGDAVRAFFFFRDLLNDSVIQLAETLGIRTAHEWGEKLREVNHFADVVLVALIEQYEAMKAE